MHALKCILRTISCSSPDRAEDGEHRKQSRDEDNGEDDRHRPFAPLDKITSAVGDRVEQCACGQQIDRQPPAQPHEQHDAADDQVMPVTPVQPAGERPW